MLNGIQIFNLPRLLPSFDLFHTWQEVHFSSRIPPWVARLSLSFQLWPLDAIPASIFQVSPCWAFSGHILVDFFQAMKSDQPQQIHQLWAFTGQQLTIYLFCFLCLVEAFALSVLQLTNEGHPEHLNEERQDRSTLFHPPQGWIYLD